MSQPTDAEIATWVRDFRSDLLDQDENRPTFADANMLETVAQRLEARGEITEAKVKAACLAYCSHPNGDAVSHGAMRAALEAALINDASTTA